MWFLHKNTKIKQIKIKFNNTHRIIMLSSRITEKLQNIRTPFYLYDMELLRETIQRIKSITAPHNYVVHYAMKANYDPRLLGCIRDAGLGVDCVSGGEVQHAIELGFDPSGVVFEGVGKRDDEIEYAINQGIFMINCESRNEIEVINEIAKKCGKTVEIGLRLNPNIDAKTNEHLTTGRSDCKFGISRIELDEVFEMQGQLQNIRIIGLHFHIGSQVQDLNIYSEQCRKAMELYEWFVGKGYDISVVNMGGGLGVDYQNPDENPVADFETYFGVFAQNFKTPEGVTVHFELGRSVVCQCGELISRVLYNKVNESRNKFAIIDAGMTELIRPALYGAVHSIENLCGKDRQQESYVIAGNVCESSDTFAYDLTLPELRRGDLVSIKSTGAYGAAMASRYNLHEIPQALYSDDI